jgi:hypothetical protein
MDNGTQIGVWTVIAAAFGAFVYHLVTAYLRIRSHREEVDKVRRAEKKSELQLAFDKMEKHIGEQQVEIRQLREDYYKLFRQNADCEKNYARLEEALRFHGIEVSYPKGPGSAVIAPLKPDKPEGGE